MKCPGQDSRYWKPGAIFEADCPECGNTLEFFKDETARKCKKCGHRLVNPKMDFGCAAYCKFAEQCLGELPSELVAERSDLLKDRVAIEMKRLLKTDFKRIGRASKVARHAERIAREEGGDIAVVVIAALLHRIEDRSQAKEILTKLGAAEPLVEQVFELIDNRDREDSKEELNQKIFSDAVAIADFEEQQKESPAEIESATKQLLTPAGRKLAENVLSARKSA